jgi:putative flippase GtrA
MVGLSGVGVATASLWLARDIVGLTLIVSGVVAHLTSVTNNFIWNQIWTFNDRRERAPAAIVFRRWLKYLLTTLVAAGIYLAVLTLLTDVVGIHHLLSSLCGIAVATPVTFLASNLWVWKTAPEPQSQNKE